MIGDVENSKYKEHFEIILGEDQDFDSVSKVRRSPAQFFT